MSMFEVILRYYDLFTQGKGDKKLIQVCPMIRQKKELNVITNL